MGGLGFSENGRGNDASPAAARRELPPPRSSSSSGGGKAHARRKQGARRRKPPRPALPLLFVPPINQPNPVSARIRPCPPVFPAPMAASRGCAWNSSSTCSSHPHEAEGGAWSSCRTMTICGGWVVGRGGCG